ncbi:SSI family serine proteinase inhibitor [Kitasatospora sp. NPDC057223]|uniref:SSI family serine proteinase inhibitor n=1 Tax=Kitasatospora sp. NPDC057223 TaxID=3346055 RepID=UPI003633741C
MISSLWWRIAATGVVCTAALTALVQAVAAQPPGPPAAVGGDHLTVTVSGSDGPAAGGTYELRCHPAGGDHPSAQGACDRLDSLTTWGRDLFAPVPPDAVCTLQYGGPATARVTGSWAGRPVDARFSRRSGCESARWDSFVPLLPAASADRGADSRPATAARRGGRAAG